MRPCADVDGWLARRTRIKSGKLGIEQPGAERGWEKLTRVRVTRQNQVDKIERRGLIEMIWLVREQNDGRAAFCY